MCPTCSRTRQFCLTFLSCSSAAVFTLIIHIWYLSSFSTDTKQHNLKKVWNCTKYKDLKNVSCVESHKWWMWRNLKCLQMTHTHTRTHNSAMIHWYLNKFPKQPLFYIYHFVAKQFCNFWWRHLIVSPRKVDRALMGGWQWLIAWSQHQNLCWVINMYSYSYFYYIFFCIF